MNYGFPEIGEAKIGEFPLNVGAEWLVQWIAEIEGRDDPFEGPLPHHILRFGQYELRDVSLNELLSGEYPYSPALAKEYSELDPSMRPPCIFDPIDLDILDGNHRAQSARIRGETTVKAYVGIIETADPNWRDWEG
jgi:hypothetical protein